MTLSWWLWTNVGALELARALNQQSVLKCHSRHSINSGMEWTLAYVPKKSPVFYRYPIRAYKRLNWTLLWIYKEPPHYTHEVMHPNTPYWPQRNPLMHAQVWIVPKNITKYHNRLLFKSLQSSQALEQRSASSANFIHYYHYYLTIPSMLECLSVVCHLPTLFCASQVIRLLHYITIWLF